MTSSRLDAIVKAYDVRGVVPDELDEPTARSLGAAFVRLLGAPRIVTAHDMRDSSPGLAAAFAEGATAQGADVVEAGLASTDLLYYASGTLDVPGAMFTASHNPARYNGIKMCRAGAAPIGLESGLADIRDLAAAGVPDAAGSSGRVCQRQLLDDYADYLIDLVPGMRDIRPLRVVVDAGNGMGGLTVPKVFETLPIELTAMYFELDGSFPHHEANPIDPANLRDLQERVRSDGADVGLAFDGDADRCFVVDERGEIVSPSVLTALIADRELGKEPGATVIHNLITSHAVPELVRERGGVPVRTRVGHSYIKAEMARTGAVFGGEHSGHFYFRDFWRADSGMLAALHVLAALGNQDDRRDRSLSELLATYARYAGSGEVNSEVADTASALAAVRSEFAGRDGVSVDELDGLTVDFGDGSWFNVRPSNTEPLLRLNVEAPDEATMAKLRDEVLDVIRR
ncbi:MAG TPA: phosphomannomutase/phosphoglucomutase [Mycobacteriales bacterium]|jgi:phosphomannomutase|nr:phosphomannomutase/phosphoglucomutase [Mycobacteriales bacterium]